MKNKPKDFSKIKQAPTSKKPKFANFLLYAAFFSVILLLFGSLWLEFTNFYREVGIAVVLFALALIFRKIDFIKWIAIIFTALYIVALIYWNINYTFIVLICLGLGVFIANLVYHEFNIPHIAYIIIPALIVGHVLWFNFLPLGYEGEFHLDVGSDLDKFTTQELYLIDRNRVLSKTQSYGEHSWRNFKEDGTITIGFNTPIHLGDKTVDFTMDYKATGPIYVNEILFYDPAWGTSVNLGTKDGLILYGPDTFESDESFDTSEDYLRNQFPRGIIINDLTGKYTDFAEEMRILYEENVNKVDYHEDWSNEDNTFKTEFRGSHSFYGLFDDQIKITLAKKDLNWYNGSDEVTLQVQDFFGNEITSLEIPDNDRDFRDSRIDSDWQNYSFTIDISDRNESDIYVISLIENPINRNEDFLVRDITVNTNKFMTKGDIFPTRPGTLYFEDGKDATFFYWWASRNQTVEFDNSTLILGQDLRNTLVTKSLLGSSQMTLEKGVVKIGGDNKFSYWENGSFDLGNSNSIQILDSQEYDNINLKLSNVGTISIRATEGTEISNIYLRLINE